LEKRVVSKPEYTISGMRKNAKEGHQARPGALL
jgi:hypothetical protein